MTARYFVETPITGDRVLLAGDEAHHLLHVMRSKIGQQVTLFDGSGKEFSARIEQLGRHDAELSVLGARSVDRESPRVLTLAVALPKGDRQRWLVEKAVELGVARLVPLETERGVAQPIDKALYRMRRAVIEASKQCGRNRLMEILDSCPWSDYSQREITDGRRWLAHPSGQASAANLSRDLAASERVNVAIGPEGGWSDEELRLGEQGGWEKVELGRRILRVETAALAVAALVAAS